MELNKTVWVCLRNSTVTAQKKDKKRKYEYINQLTDHN